MTEEFHQLVTNTSSTSFGLNPRRKPQSGKAPTPQTPTRNLAAFMQAVEERPQRRNKSRNRTYKKHNRSRQQKREGRQYQYPNPDRKAQSHITRQNIKMGDMMHCCIVESLQNRLTLYGNTKRSTSKTRKRRVQNKVDSTLNTSHTALDSGDQSPENHSMTYQGIAESRTVLDAHCSSQARDSLRPIDKWIEKNRKAA
jgi:hypothetical protein